MSLFQDMLPNVQVCLASLSYTTSHLYVCVAAQITLYLLVKCVSFLISVLLHSARFSGDLLQLLSRYNLAEPKPDTQ